jgi:hypothetical protein
MPSCKAYWCKKEACDSSKYCKSHKCPLCNAKLITPLLSEPYCKGETRHYFRHCLNRFGPKEKLCTNIVPEIQKQCKCCKKTKIYSKYYSYCEKELIVITSCECGINYIRNPFKYRQITHIEDIPRVRELQQFFDECMAEQCDKCKCKAPNCSKRNSVGMSSNYCPGHTCQKDCERSGMCGNYKDKTHPYCDKHTGTNSECINAIAEVVVSKLHSINGNEVPPPYPLVV